MADRTGRFEKECRMDVASPARGDFCIAVAVVWYFLRSALINCFRCDGFIRQVKKVIMVKGSHETAGSSKIKCSIQKVYRAG